MSVTVVLIPVPSAVRRMTSAAVILFGVFAGLAAGLVTVAVLPVFLLEITSRNFLKPAVRDLVRAVHYTFEYQLLHDWFLWAAKHWLHKLMEVKVMGRDLFPLWWWAGKYISA